MQEPHNWAEAVLAETPGYEAELFQRYSNRLMAFARSRLPGDLSSRVNEEDVVQSVFRSFFRRNGDGQYDFKESCDVWQLLAAITYNKVINTVRHHRRQCRNSQLDEGIQTGLSAQLADRSPTPDELNVMYDYLHWIMDQLPDVQKEMLRLRLEGYSNLEISQRVSLSQRTVKRALARVRELIVQRNKKEMEG